MKDDIDIDEPMISITQDEFSSMLKAEGDYAQIVGNTIWAVAEFINNSDRPQPYETRRRDFGYRITVTPIQFPPGAEYALTNHPKKGKEFDSNA